jgi:hypothetical protein
MLGQQLTKTVYGLRYFKRCVEVTFACSSTQGKVPKWMGVSTVRGQNRHGFEGWTNLASGEL